MPLPSNSYYPLFPVQEQIIDSTTGLPLAAGIVSFFQDIARTVPKNVYQRTENPDNTFTYVSLGNVLTLSAIGTFVDGSLNNIIPFLWPFLGLPDDIPVSTVVDLYYITVTSSGLVPEFTVSAWPPEVTSPASSVTTFIGSDNIISNPQFAVVNFESPVTLTVTGNSSIEIAPDWNVITTGSGTITLSQIPVNDTGAPGLPAFALQITSASVSSCILSQTIKMSPRILETGFASGTFIAQSITPNTPTIVMNFVPSDPAFTSVLLATGVASSGAYTLINRTAQVSPPDLVVNPDDGNLGYVNIQIVIPVNNEVNISCVQLVSVPDVLTVAAYAQQSTPRQIDHLFHYYNPKLQYKPIPSWLVGWDFTLNPCQALGPAAGPVTNGLVNNSYYIADQTIIFQSVDGSFTLQQSQRGFNLTTSNNTTFAVIQYLPQSVALDLLKGKLSVALSTDTTQSSINGTVNLYWTAGSIPSLLTPTFASLVSSVAAGPVTTVAGGWTLVPRVIGPATFVATPSSGSSGIPSVTGPFAFSGWDPTGVNTSTATAFAIVISYDTLNSGNLVALQYCSLNSGDIATKPSPQTLDEVLRECQYYYEMSYDVGQVPGVSTSTDGAIMVAQNNLISVSGGSPSVNVYSSSFTLSFNGVKRSAAPNIYFYAYGSTSVGVVTANLINNNSSVSPTTPAITNWNQQSVGMKAASYTPANVSSLIATAAANTKANAWIQFQYVVDARLGVV